MEFQVVLRADGLVRLPPRPYPLVKLTSGHEVRIRPYVTDEAVGHPVTRGLYVQIHGPEESITAAEQRFAEIGVGFASAMSLAANASSGEPRLTVALECTPGIERRDFRQRLLESRSGPPTQGRLLPVDAFARLLEAVMSASSKRLGRGIAQYHHALTVWTPGYEILPLAHLFMAVDTLVPVVRERHLQTTGLSVEDLARSYGIDIANRGWRPQLDGRLRTEFFFDGDDSFARTVREASDGFEHGFLDFAEIRATATPEVRMRLAHAVRDGIIRLAGADDSTRQALLAPPYATPLGVGSVVPFLEGVVTGPDAANALHDLAAFPHLEFGTQLLGAEEREDGSTGYRVHMNYTMQNLPEGLQLEVVEHSLRGPEGAHGIIAVSELADGKSGDLAEDVEGSPSS